MIFGVLILRKFDINSLYICAPQLYAVATLPGEKSLFCQPKYICDQNWVKLSLLACTIWCSQRFRVIACCVTLTVDPLTPKSNQHEHIHISSFCHQNLVKFLSLVFTRT